MPISADPPSTGGNSDVPAGMTLIGIEKFFTVPSGTSDRAVYLTTDSSPSGGFDRFRVQIGATVPLPGFPAPPVHQAAPWNASSHQVIGESFLTWDNNWTVNSWYSVANGPTADLYSWPFTLGPGYYKWNAQIWIGSVTNGNVSTEQAISSNTSGLWMDSYDINFTINPGTQSVNTLRALTGSTYGSTRYVSGALALPDTQETWYIDTGYSIFELNTVRGGTRYYRCALEIEKYAYA